MVIIGNHLDKIESDSQLCEYRWLARVSLANAKLSRLQVRLSCGYYRTDERSNKIIYLLKFAQYRLRVQTVQVSALGITIIHRQYG